MKWYDGTAYMGEWKFGKQTGWGSLKIGNDIKTGFFQNNNYVGTSAPLETTNNENV